MNSSKLSDNSRFRTISRVGLVEVRKLAEEIRRIVGFDEVISVISEGHCTWRL